MVAATVVVHDATHDGIGGLPPGLAAGYTTGTGGVPWTAEDWAAHPGAVRIDQDPAASDATADVLDVERGAASPDDCPGWAKRALAAYHAGTRPGQRSPAIYASQSAMTSVTGALANGGVSSGIGLWVASWGIGQAKAIAMIENASGPYPVIGVQYASLDSFDTSVFSAAWLEAVSGQPAPDAPRFPYPVGDYLGELSRDPHCHSGYYTPDARNVATWQQQMAARGWRITVDGRFGPQSDQVCRVFQQEKGLAADGKVGPVTWRAAWAAPVT